MELFIPQTTRSTNQVSKPWFDKKAKLAVERKRCAFTQKQRGEISTSTWKSIRNRCQSIIDQSKQNFEKSVSKKLASCPNGSRSFWTLAKTIQRNFTKSSFPPLSVDDGSIVTSPQDKADLFAKIFAANSTIDPTHTTPPKIPATQQTMPNITFHHRIIRKILRNLDVKKASGPDGIPPIVLKKCAPELTPILCRLFKLSYSHGIFPDTWKFAHVQPVPKKGKKTDPSNYRPIALISVLSKVMEKCVNIQLLKFLESSELLSDHQYGFRQSRSTGDILAYVTHLWTTAITNHGEVQAVALDISKAFDQVWHSSLTNKLPSYGLPLALCRWLSSFLSNRSIAVVADGAVSQPFQINAGVPQGSVLSPTLFLLHINDLLTATSNPIHSFADDTTLHTAYSSLKPLSATESKSKKFQKTESLNKDLAKIISWGSRNLVKFNATKTQSCTFSKKRSSEESPIQMSGQTVSNKNSIHVLGVTISNNITWDDHITSIAKSAAQKLGFLYRSKRYFSPQQLLTLYKSQVRPGLEYCSHVWGSAPKSTLKLLDSVQKRAVRLIGDTKLTDSLPSLAHRRAVGDLALFYRYFHGKCSSEIKSIMPALASFNRPTRHNQSWHPFAVQLKTQRTTYSKASFVYRTSLLWNSLPAQIFPSNYNLQQFKARVNKLNLELLSQPPSHTVTSCTRGTAVL